VAAAAAAAVTLTFGGSDPAARLPRGAIGVEVGAATGQTIRPGFVGISLEYTSLLRYAGADPRAPNPTFVRLLRNLTPYGAPVIRIGGDSTDWTWWPLAGVAKPPGVSYALTPRWIAVARATARKLGARLVLGVNLEADSGRVAGGEARALLHGIGSRYVSAFELGNEPEAYPTIGWYTNPHGVSVPGRPPDYGVRAYIADYAAISRWLPAGVPLAGPALASTGWLGSAPEFLAANPRVRLLTFHFYPLRRCDIPRRSRIYPTIPHLLAPAAAAPAANLRPAIAAARARGVAVRVDELNTVSCKGKLGVSNTFASALWVSDALFRMARAGVDGVNVHTLARASYAPFAFTRRDGRWLAEVRPLYYGLLLFGRAAPAGARLLSTRHPALGGLETWATRGPGGTVRVLIINDSPTRRLVLAVRAPRPAASAQLQRLRAPGLAATSGVTLAGQSYGALSATARLTGRRRLIELEPVAGRFVLTLPAASAALLTLAG
jgi:hypothetical protein